ncbi:DUF433 domain-containing protein [Neolewinella sp.]|uniref:DUF433 domain-containing protein n=1 Tax=Neolewinella sp. TaxID=2993543 RepID=UPI003B51890E
MDWTNFITADKDVLAGKPRIKGTRLSVELIVGRLADGWSEAEVLENYPSLTKKSLQAAHAYTYELMNTNAVYTAPHSKPI